MARIEAAWQVVRHGDIERPQPIDTLAHVRRREYQHGLIEGSRAVYGKVEVIAGHRHAHVRHIRFGHRDETKLFPELAHRLEIGRGHAELREVAAQRALAAIALTREMRRRFLHAHRLAGRIEESEFVERILADALPGYFDTQLFDAMDVLRDVRLYV